MASLSMTDESHWWRKVSPLGRRTETVPRHRGPHYLCPQCRDINPLHLNARRARFAYSSRYSLVERTLRQSGVEGRRKEEEGEGGRNTKNDRTLYPHLAYGGPRHRRALVESCHLSWNSWGQVAFEWVVFRVRRTRSNSTKRVLSTYSK